MSIIEGIMSWVVRSRTGLPANAALEGTGRPPRRTASTRPIVVLLLCRAILIALVVGADGRLISSSQAWPPPSLNFAGGDFFEALKNSPRLSSMLGEPMRDPLTGVWTICFARKFRGSNGEFLGMVVGTVASQYFE